MMSGLFSHVRTDGTMTVTQTALHMLLVLYQCFRKAPKENVLWFVRPYPNAVAGSFLPVQRLVSQKKRRLKMSRE